MLTVLEGSVHGAWLYCFKDYGKAEVIEGAGEQNCSPHSSQEAERAC